MHNTSFKNVLCTQKDEFAFIASLAYISYVLAYETDSVMQTLYTHPGISALT